MKGKATAVITMAAMAIVMAVGTGALAAGKAKSNVGPVVITYMQRVEAQTDVPSPGTVSGENFLYSMLSAFRKLDKGVSGNIYFMNKSSIDDGRALSNITGLDIAKDLTGKWKLDAGYSYNSNPERNTVPSSDSDRFSFSVGFKPNPNAKVGRKYDVKTTFSTGTDFSVGRTLSWKLGATRTMTKHWNYNLAYTFVWGLQNKQPNIKKEHYNNQYSADFTFKLSKKQKVTISYLFLKNLFHAALRTGDNSMYRLSYFITLR
jgi:hypothetical protein